MPKLTQTVVTLAQATARESFLWDTEIRGFGLRVKPSGAKTWLVQYRHRGRTRRCRIGDAAVMKAEEARRLARELLVAVDKGRDPSAERKLERNALTMVEFADKFLARHRVGRRDEGRILSRRTEALYRGLITRFISPALGRHLVLAVTPADVDHLHAVMKDTPRQANQVVALLGVMFAWAERLELRPPGSNPARHVTRYAERARERFLTPDEFARLDAVLTDAERTHAQMPSVIAAIRLLLFTGARLSEILTLRWSQVDAEHRLLRLDESKTGRSVRHLNAPALEVLACIQREPGSPWVIRGKKPGTHLVNLEKPWRRIRKEAGLDDVRLHDLRHSFASVGAGLGEGIAAIGKLLGHSQIQTTQRYAHLAADPVRIANERIGQAITRMMRR